MAFFFAMTVLIKYLSEFITEKRLETFKDVLSMRTRHISVVLEDIYQPHNASAVLRSCDCFGIQDVHIIENENEYSLNPDVALGSSKWINMIKYNKTKNNTSLAINRLRKSGYRIIATTLHEKKSTSLEELDLKKGKIALFFGTEMKGLSKKMLSEADEYITIPMFGFTESLNISVATAISLYYLTNKLRNSDIKWELSLKEKNEIILAWLMNSIKNSAMIVDKFYKQ